MIRMAHRAMEEEVHDGLKLAADTVRIREEWLEDKRSERDQLIYEANQAGYSFGEIAEVTELAKSTVALVCRIQSAMRQGV
jgi:DNA-binding NarL/FixJ family response regulator